jgi:hypothetical protein
VYTCEFGLWRSLVARLLGVQEVVGSNPASPTKYLIDLQTRDQPHSGLWSPPGVQNLAISLAWGQSALSQLLRGLTVFGDQFIDTEMVVLQALADSGFGQIFKIVVFEFLEEAPDITHELVQPLGS